MTADRTSLLAKGKAEASAKGKPRANIRLPRPVKPAIVDRRDAILAVAARRFAEFGFASTTVRQISDDVHMLSGSLYHHFATKEDILHHLIREVVQRLRDQAVQIATLPLDAESRLVKLVVCDLEEMTSNQAVHAILYNERKFFRRAADFKYAINAKKETYVAWQSILEDGVREKLFSPDIDIYMTISTIFRMLNSAADWYKNEDGSVLDVIGHYSLEKVVDFYLTFILRSIRSSHRAHEAIPTVAPVTAG